MQRGLSARDIAGRAKRAMMKTASRFPTDRALDRAARHVGPVDLALVCVYRSANASNVQELIDNSRIARDRVALWALDEVHPALADVTVGCGPGGRFELLTRCVDDLKVKPGTWLALVDDDIRLVRGDLAKAAAVAAHYGLNLVQPAHDWSSATTFRLTRAMPFAVARETGFVEIGPAVLMDATARDLVLPFPLDTRMGWGEDVRWASLRRQGLRLGLVDAVRVQHLSPVAAGYSVAAEGAATEVALARYGFENMAVLHRNIRRHFAIP